MNKIKEKKISDNEFYFISKIDDEFSLKRKLKIENEIITINKNNYKKDHYRYFAILDDSGKFFNGIVKNNFLLHLLHHEISCVDDAVILKIDTALEKGFITTE